MSDELPVSAQVLAAYCHCGESVKCRAVTGVGTVLVTAILERFWRYHIGTGHGATDATGAVTGRQKRRRREVRN